MHCLHLIKTKSFQSDGRLLKWISSLRTYEINSDAFVLEDENIKKRLVINDVNISTTSLFFRRFFAQRKGYLFKVPEFSVKTLIKVLRSKYSFYVFHDNQHYLTLFLLCIINQYYKKKIVWDLHELPHPQLGNSSFTRNIIKYIFKNVDLVIYTNSSRREYVQKLFLNENSKYAILNNYPDLDYITRPKASMPKGLNEWLKGKPYVLWMGLASKERNFPSALSSLYRHKDNIKLVIMGNVEKELKSLTEYDNNFIYNKFVSQDEIVQYVDNALFSIVLYNQNSPNNLYCEPNRLYQLITRGIPVICGNNPTMKDTLNKTGGGIVLEDDGRSVELLSMAVDMMQSPNIRAKYVDELSSQNFNQSLSWDFQIESIATLLHKL